MDTMMEMLERLREERGRAELRALEYAKYADCLQRALERIARCTSKDLEPTWEAEVAREAILEAEARLDRSLYGK